METPQVRRIISFKPIFMKFIKDEKTLKLVKDKNHFPILKLLKKEPMTVKELEEEYELLTEKKKSNKTIYRYLKTLEEAGLVVPAGNLVTTGKTATETIYARTAMGFYMKGSDHCFWDTEKADRIVENVGFLLEPLFEGKKADMKKLAIIMENQSDCSEMGLEDLVKEVEDKNIHTMQDCDLDEINIILKFTGLFAGLIKNPNIVEELKSCYK